MRYLASFMLAASLCGMPALVGCDKAESHEETVTHSSDGSSKVEEKTTTEHPDGSVSKSTETKRMNP